MGTSENGIIVTKNRDLQQASMGGQVCSDCTQCISTEFDLVKSLGQQKANQVFQKHWKTWFNQTDVDTLKSLGLNTVRIPVSLCAWPTDTYS